jgi:hypothetical protein
MLHHHLPQTFNLVKKTINLIVIIELLKIAKSKDIKTKPSQNMATCKSYQIFYHHQKSISNLNFKKTIVTHYYHRIRLKKV